VATFLGGTRAVTVVQPPSPKRIELQVVVPVEDMTELDTMPGRGAGDDEDGAAPRRSIWPHVEERVLDLIEQHRSTIVFANSRRLAERLCGRLNELAAERAEAAAEVWGGGEPPHERGDPGGRPPGPAQHLNQIGPARGGPGRPAEPGRSVVPREAGATSELRDHDHLVGLRAPVALRDLELDPLSLFEGAVAIHLDGGEVHKHVPIAAVPGTDLRDPDPAGRLHVRHLAAIQTGGGSDSCPAAELRRTDLPPLDRRPDRVPALGAARDTASRRPRRWLMGSILVTAPSGTG